VKDMRLEGRILIIIPTVITAVAALFCIIGLATKGWLGGVVGLFCSGCSQSSAALSIISFILLIVSIVALVLVMFDILNGILRYIPFILLFVATIFLLATFASYPNSVVASSIGYSYNLMVVAHFFSYIALAVTAYWYGQTDAASSSAN
jgi:hypothetical protein